MESILKNIFVKNCEKDIDKVITDRRASHSLASSIDRAQL
uniref:Uncharacterized protein n=1 Tax=Amphimedon queenslandica TaxID=400682 RepID=A0A1X7VCT8_AMPQE